MRKDRTGAAFKRTGLHRLNCPVCSGYTYSTVANLETVGIPRCACGETLQPERLELAMLLGAEDAPVMVAYLAKCSSVAHGQAWTEKSGLAAPEQRAYESISREQRKASRERRLNALMPVAEPMAF